MGMVGCFTAVDKERLQEFVADPARVTAYLNDEDEAYEERTFDVDKAWHGIHFLLTGQPWGGKEPLGWAVLGGEAIGEDVGYGPARLLMPEQVADVAGALAAIDEAQFRSRFAPEAMGKADIYPDIWMRDGQEALDYIAHYYVRLVDFYSKAAARGDGMLLWMC